MSVLTPVYNGEKYLKECIESVLAQTYHNWEYVIVNNCSTDGTLEVAQKYSQQDARIRVHNNREFVGMSANHNIALRQISADSKYCKIVHADDWLFPDCLRQMVELADTHPSVAIVGAYGLGGERVRWDGLPFPSTVIPGREICRKTLLGGLYVFGSQTSHLIRSDAIRSRQDYYNTHELHTQFADQEACFETLRNADFGFVHQVLTYSRTHDESVTSLYGQGGFNTDLPALINILKKFGPVYLNPTEYEVRWKRLMDLYYSYLGQNFFYCRGKKFWDFHRTALSHLGHPLRRSSLLRAAMSEVFDTLSNPLRMVFTVFSARFKSESR